MEAGLGVVELVPLAGLVSERGDGLVWMEKWVERVSYKM
jgi:hypothetical protein